MKFNVIEVMAFLAAGKEDTLSYAVRIVQGSLKVRGTVTCHINLACLESSLQ